MEFFSGDTDTYLASDWLKRFLLAVQKTGLETRQFSTVFGKFLTGKALEWYSGLADQIRNSFEALVIAFLGRFCLQMAEPYESTDRPALDGDGVEELSMQLDNVQLQLDYLSTFIEDDTYLWDGYDECD